jgi:hypothetical protein
MKYSLIGAILVTLLIVYTVFFKILHLDKNSQWLSYLESVYHFEVIVLILGLILNQIVVENEAKVTHVDRINSQQELGFIDIEKTFMKNFPELLPLYKELNQQNPLLQSSPIPQNIDPIKKNLLETNICNIIIQRIENIYLTILHIKGFADESIEFAEWMETWRLWFLSPTLRRIWNLNKNLYFSASTRHFIDNQIINNDGGNPILKRLRGGKPQTFKNSL